jgi:hypothetical protein
MHAPAHVPTPCKTPEPEQPEQFTRPPFITGLRALWVLLIAAVASAAFAGLALFGDVYERLHDDPAPAATTVIVNEIHVHYHFLGSVPDRDNLPVPTSGPSQCSIPTYPPVTVVPTGK